MNISLPESLKSFVEEQVSLRGYGTSSEYMRELIRKDQDRMRLRNLLLAGATSPQTETVDTPRYAHQLDLPALRVRSLTHPYLVFYVERPDHIDVWRLLHRRRDVAAWMLEPEA